MTCETAAPEPCDAGSPPPPDPLWDAVRDAYLAGATVASLREDFGIPSSTFYKRAGREGWLHRPRAMPEDAPLDLDAPVAEPDAMLDLAWRRLSHAIEQGRSTDALRWLRIHDGLRALVAASPVAASQGAPAQLSAPTVEKVETVFRDSTAAAARPPLNRAERRRLARMRGGP